MLKHFNKDNLNAILQHTFSLLDQSKLNYKEMVDYIEAFSAYLCKKDNSYHYNYNFLTWKNLEFQEFLNNAAAKRDTLTEFFSRLECFPQFTMMTKQENETGPVVISLNNLWKITTAGGECVLVEDFDIEGAACKPSSDIITLWYGGHSSSFNPTVDEESLTQILENLMGYGLSQGDEHERSKNKYS